MRKTTIGLLTFFRLAQLFIIGFAPLIIAKALRQPTLFYIVGSVVFLMNIGVLLWMVQQMIEDVKRWDTPERRL